MNKELKKCYHYMDLPYNSTVEEIKAKQDALLKINASKAKITGKSCEKELNKINNSAKSILDNIKKNGIPNIKEGFNSSWQSICAQIIGLIFIGAICFASFYILL